MNIQRCLKRFICSFLLLTFFATALQAETNFLSVNDAFVLKASIQEDKPNTVLVHFDIAPGYYLYREHFRLFSAHNDPIPSSAIAMPKAITKHDADLGDILI